MCTLLCVCPPRAESLFPPVLSKSCSQIPLAFKVWFARNSSSHCQTPRLGSLMWGSEPSLQWVDFCGITVLQLVSHPPSSYGIWFYCDCSPPTISLWLLLVFGCGVSFLVSSSVFLSMIVQQLAVIPVLSQEGVSACPSTLSSWTSLSNLLLTDNLYNLLECKSFKMFLYLQWLGVNWMVMGQKMILPAPQNSPRGSHHDWGEGSLNVFDSHAVCHSEIIVITCGFEVYSVQWVADLLLNIFLHGANS